jgi:hypothetical protein
MHFKLGFAAATAVAALALAQPATAQTVTPPRPTPTAAADEFADDRRVLSGDQAVFGQRFVLRSNETLRGDLAIFGGSATLERGSIVEGDVALFGGSLDAAGRIRGDLVQMGGDVELRETARVDEESHRFGGSRRVAPGAYVREDAQYEVMPRGWFVPNLTNPMHDGQTTTGWGWNADVWKVFPGSLLITLAALLAWAVLPRHIDRAVDAARARPLFVGGIGAVAWLFGAVALTISLVLIVTLCINPLVALAAIGLSWTVTARIVGAEVMRAFDRVGTREWQPTAQVVIGSLLMALLGAIPILGDLFGFAFTSLGLGALVLTHLGTREWRPQQTTTDDGPGTTVNDG